jgi:hypothetical protein
LRNSRRIESDSRGLEIGRCSDRTGQIGAASRPWDIVMLLVEIEWREGGVAVEDDCGSLLGIYTRWHCGQEHRCGSREVGKHAGATLLEGFKSVEEMKSAAAGWGRLDEVGGVSLPVPFSRGWLRWGPET